MRDVKILVADDERNIADSTVMILQEHGYDAKAAYSGLEALKISETYAPDVLLADVIMPGMNGFELALQLKTRFPNCKLLLFSGQASTVSMAQQFSARFTTAGFRFELLPKPLHPNFLLSKIEQVLLTPI